jgi:hypothetical protein
MKNALSGPTYYDRCLNLFRNYQEYKSNPRSLLVAVARRDPWRDENNPPLLHPIADQISDPILFAQVHQCQPAYEDNDGNVRFSAENAYQKNFRGGTRPPAGSEIVFSSMDTESVEELIAAKATHLVVTASVPRDALTSLAPFYRVVALCSHVEYASTPPANVVPGGWLLPSAVSSYKVRWLATTVPVPTDEYSVHSFRVIRRY